MKKQSKWTGEQIGKYCIFNESKGTLVILSDFFRKEEEVIDGNFSKPKDWIRHIIDEVLSSSEKTDLFSHPSSLLREGNIISDNGDIVVYAIPRRELALDLVQEIERYVIQDDDEESENDPIGWFWFLFASLIDFLYAVFFSLFPLPPLKSKKESKRNREN